jgi:hypothetical protein
MNWEKLSTSKTLEIIRKDRLGHTSKCNMAPEDSWINVTDKDKEISVIPHNTVHYNITLRQDNSNKDWLFVGVVDESRICYIARRALGHPLIEESYLFEDNQLVSFRSKLEFGVDKSYFPSSLLVSVRGVPIPLRTHSGAYIDMSIPDNRESVLDPNLNPHYESFKQIRPDIAQSLEECLNELRR